MRARMEFVHIDAGPLLFDVFSVWGQTPTNAPSPKKCSYLYPPPPKHSPPADSTPPPRHPRQRPAWCGPNPSPWSPTLGPTSPAPSDPPLPLPSGRALPLSIPPRAFHGCGGPSPAVNRLECPPECLSTGKMLAFPSPPHFSRRPLPESLTCAQLVKRQSHLCFPTPGQLSQPFFGCNFLEGAVPLLYSATICICDF